MQHLPKGVQDREGCFVFQVVGPGDISVRSAVNVGEQYRTGEVLRVGDLVSVDLVRHSRVAGSRNGPFLRLSDCSGWLFEMKNGERCMQEVPVQSGLWCFYVDNAPAGQALRYHPIDSENNHVKDVTYHPMQKIYCDRKVFQPDTGVSFYRVQGTDGWVFDKRPASDVAHADTYMLLDEGMVQIGHFAYRAVKKLAIRRRPSVDDKSKTPRAIRQGDLVAINAIRKSPHGSQNGSFLRLNDGSGWLFERKRGESVMVPVHIQTGSWTLKVVNEFGIAVRRQPIDCKEMKSNKIYPAGSIVHCDKMVMSESGVKFYLLEKTDNDWVFDRRDGYPMMALQTSIGPNEEISFTSSTSWTPVFVRGVAVSVEGLTEIAFTPASRLISFQSFGGTRINVYYTTRTFGTAIDHHFQGKTQLFRRNCSASELLEIFKNPRVHTGRGYKRRRSSVDSPIVSTTYGSGILVEEEEEIRNDVLDCDQEIQKLLKKRAGLLSIVRSSDLKRTEAAESAKKLEEKRQHELQEAQRIEQERERALAEIARQERVARELQERTRSGCGRVFPNTHARAQHYRAVHEFACDYCLRIFSSVQSLNQQRDALGHW